MATRGLPTVLWVLIAAGAVAGPPEPAKGGRLEAAASPASPTGSRWWDGRVFYEVFVRSFADSTTGPLAGDGIGDIRGLIERLDYLNDGDPSTHDDLGVEGIWLMPIMPATSPAGYAITDFYEIREDYGTREDFARLVTEAHRRGIRVIIDLVLNHTAVEHEWFVAASQGQSPYEGFYVWADEPPTGYGEGWRDRWCLNEANGRWFYSRFGDTVADLNFHEPEVTAALRDVTRYWIETTEIDGYRLDAIRHLFEDAPREENVAETHEWLRAHFAFMKDLAPDLLAIGEVWDTTENVLEYGPDQMDMHFQFDLAGALLRSVEQGDARPLREAQEDVWQAFAPGQYATFLSNHDQSRVMSQLGHDPDKARLAATILLTSPGVPFIYYGEEIGMASGAESKPERRSPMQWTGGPKGGFTSGEPYRALNSDRGRANVASQTDDAGSLLSHYRRLIDLRQGHTALSHGDWSAVETEGPSASLYAFVRRSPEETLLVLANLGPTAATDYGLELPPGLRPRTETRELLTGAPVSGPGESMGADGRYRPFDVVEGLSAYLIRL